MRPLAENPLYKKECGDCHTAFHPSLLPSDSWKKVMGDLSDHFGEDATLDEPKLGDIAAYLIANGAETWDTEAANRFRRVSAEDPRRITATRYWKRKHKDIAPAVFAQKNVGGKANCGACHTDADTGRFDDQAIKIPKEEVK
jgi:mono/diheme cytochrome c family protein